MVSALLRSGLTFDLKALARAIYARRDIMLLDDTMSALDVKTQALIIKNLFSKGGILRQLGTTVVWATHSSKHILSSVKIKPDVPLIY